MATKMKIVSKGKMKMGGAMKPKMMSGGAKPKAMYGATMKPDMMQTGGAKKKSVVVAEKNKITSTPGRRITMMTNNKGDIKSAHNRNTKQKYNAYDSGVVAVENMGGAPKYSASIDTTGFSAGKKNYPTTIKKEVKLADGRKGTKITKYNTSRQNVMPTLKKMETSVTTPKKKTTAKKVSTAGKKLMR
jgi:hypothetical protein